MAAAAAMAALGRSLTAALRLPRARPGLPGYAPRRADSGSGMEGRARFSRGRRAYGGRRVSVCPGSASLRAAARMALNLYHKNLPKIETLHQVKFLHTTVSRRGLEEFFDDPANWGEKSVKSGDSWNIKQLRGKSSEDLHKLWYVLLKEKNMLLTLEQESKRQRKAMPSPERLEKVETSMKNIDLVVREREIALRLLQTGHEKPVPGEWRHDFLGRTFWYSYKEWPIPWHLNKKHKKKRFYYLPHVNHFIRLRLEKTLRKRARQQSLERTRRKVLERKFPDVAVKAQSQ
ncbi:39S ribosomal protein L47, mitochondrial isoform X1 [Serinus canaria]|uniref:39S ribosomal protein L47, mitochondrial isoform X1 n=1 Tax=Serinus canaria TaxID=9135 RepID=UPI0021CCD4B4|nr:39S ribosomal protein L47, mitochondrial isoform X1 [Serinus canaria]